MESIPLCIIQVVLLNISVIRIPSSGPTCSDKWLPSHCTSKKVL